MTKQVRDWNKDMKLSAELHAIGSPLELEEIAIYWMNQYAAEKERADKVQEEYRYALMVKEDFVNGYHVQEARAAAAEAREKKLREARPISEWHEDCGDVLWWTFPIEEAPYCGSPLDVDWPGYHTHWTPFVVPEKEGNIL